MSVRMSALNCKQDTSLSALRQLQVEIDTEQYRATTRVAVEHVASTVMTTGPRQLDSDNMTGNS